MYYLPKDNYNNASNGCNEKIQTYRMLALNKFPVLNSVIITKKDLELWNEKIEKNICEILNSKNCMIRYLYKEPNYRIRNGGEITSISKENLINLFEENADLWLLEPCSRNDNIFCCNICVKKPEDKLHIEVLGRGFDISDLNKGVITPHESIDLPYPIRFGTYGEWWRWAKIHIMPLKEYKKSIVIRKKRLIELGTINNNIIFDEKFKPLDISMIEKILFNYLEKIENLEYDFKCYNISCSVLKNGKMIFWDIQSPTGKLMAYIGCNYPKEI